MPNSLQTLDTNFPKIDNHQTTEENFLQVTNYLYMLLENLRYTLGNLGEDNFNDTELDGIAKMIREPIMVQLKDTEGRVANLGIEAARLSARLEDAEGNINAFNATAAGWYARIEDAEGNISNLSATSQLLSSQISSLDGTVSNIQQTANTLTTRIQTAEGDISSLTQTANSLSSKVSDAEGNLSSLTQTVNGMSLSVSNGNSSSTIKLMRDGVAVSSKTIQFTGMVTFSDLSTQNSKTVIHGGNITTGSIKAIDIYGSRFYNTGGKTWMEVGKDLDGADNDAFALYVSHKNYADTGVFSVFNGDGGVVTFGAKGFSFLGVDADLSVKKVKILVGSDGKYWEFSTTGIKFLDKNDNVINRVTLDN